MIKILGTLKGVAIKSSLDNNNEEVDIVTLKLEMTAGQNEMHDIRDLLKEIIEVTLDSRQPGLPMK